MKRNATMTTRTLPCAGCGKEFNPADLDAHIPLNAKGDPVRIKGEYPLKCRSCHPAFMEL